MVRAISMKGGEVLDGFYDVDSRILIRIEG